jgi:hypothetical protein
MTSTPGSFFRSICRVFHPGSCFFPKAQRLDSHNDHHPDDGGGDDDDIISSSGSAKISSTISVTTTTMIAITAAAITVTGDATTAAHKGNALKYRLRRLRHFHSQAAR